MNTEEQAKEELSKTGEEAVLDAQLNLLWTEFQQTVLVKNIARFFPTAIVEDSTDQFKLCLYKAYLMGQLVVIQPGNAAMANGVKALESAIQAFLDSQK